MSSYSVYSTAKAEATRNVTYRCEKCDGEFSYKLVLSQGAGEGGEDYFSSPESRHELAIKLKVKAGKSAIDLLNKQIETLTHEENYGFEKCPNCEHIQSWMLAHAKIDHFDSAKGLPIAIITILLGAIAYFLPRNAWFQISQTLSCIISFAIWLIVMKPLIDRAVKDSKEELNRAQEETERVNSPNVEWHGPILTEDA